MKNKKLVLSIVFATIFVLVILFSIVIPTFSRFQSGLDDPEWDGLASNSFKKGTGTSDDPYIISTPNEFAYFALSMENDDYDDKYIKLTKDIIINKGVFKENTYIYNDITYYLGNDNKYYLDEDLNTEIGSIKEFPMIKGFKGNFDGDFHTIYGLYERNDDKNSLFTDFSGKLTNLYIDNAYIKGGYITAGVISNANNASIKNVMFNGKVLGNSETKEETKTIEIDDFIVTDAYNETIELPIVSNISKNILKGTCSGTDSFTLNNNEYECNEFEIETTNNIEIKVSSEASFKDITYTLTYDLNKTSGIVGISSNTELEGLINKGNISGIYASGIIGTSINTNIKDSYNNGKIIGMRSSGIIDTIMYSNNYLRNIYNSGELHSDIKAGLVSKVYNSTITVEKAFNTYEAYTINDNTSSLIETEDSYNTIGYNNNGFKALNLNIIDSLYPDYIDNNNISNGNIWIKKELPILYFDDIKNRTVQVKIGNNIWDSFDENYEDIKYDEKIDVLISTTDMYKPIKNVWCYPSNEIIDKENLESIEWKEYKGIFSLEEDVYILYVKYEDYNDNTYYISTDKLIIGSIQTNISINSGNISWNTNHNPKNKFLNKNYEYEIINNGKTLSISKIEYIISPSIMKKEDLEKAEWIIYEDIIKPVEDSYIIYVKVTNVDKTITYLNTDKMINMSYRISNLKSGNNLEYSKSMTYNSSFNFNVELKHKVSLSNYKRYIKVDKMLPKNTKITIKDNNNYYEYITDIEDKDTKLNSYIYPLSRFKKVGKVTFDEYFDNNYYNNLDNEVFNIYIDFINTSKTIDEYNLSFIAKNTEIINTEDTKNIVFNLVDEDTNLSITTDYNDSINYGIENIYNINLNINLNNNVLNTNYENLYEGISIEVHNKDNELVSRNDLNNIRFKYNDTIYVLDRNNRINISLGKEHNQNINLQILTYNSDTNIDDTYNIIITGYLSIDGINKKYSSSNNVSIPLILKKTNDLDYSFDVTLKEPIINKGGSFNFNINYEGKLVNPKLRVSLYKKKELTAYNQEYELVDLKDYVFNKVKDTYDVKNLVLNIKNNVESNGYKFVFELFDNEEKITTVDIKTIIR